ncbi:MAG: hypothetical protein FJY58_10290, partial [Betaproteobacteria bacterium]|nr:hypothetical protein [Betaproteobacteria bacterium]
MAHGATTWHPRLLFMDQRQRLDRKVTSLLVFGQVAAAFMRSISMKNNLAFMRSISMKNNPAVTNTKKQSRRKFLLNTTATVAALCAPSLLKGYSIAQAKTSSSGVLRVATPATPTGFDREFNVTTGDLEQSSNLATPMLTWDTAPAFGIDSNWKVYEQDAKKIAPGLAESWSLDNDGKKLILKLRQGLISNHGNELTADDAVWTYNRVHALKGASSFLFFE